MDVNSVGFSFSVKSHLIVFFFVNNFMKLNGNNFPFISLNLPLVVVDNDKIIPSQHGGLADN